jgi:hypothetical protein
MEALLANSYCQPSVTQPLYKLRGNTSNADSEKEHALANLTDAFPDGRSEIVPRKFR